MQRRSQRDFFISFTKADRSWAEWIAWSLELEGYQVIYQDWDFRPGMNLPLEIDRAVSTAKRILVILSTEYLADLHAQPQWASAFNLDPTGEKGLLLPVRIRHCEPTGLLSTIVSIDLVNLNEQVARDKLMEGVRNTRVKPSTSPMYPIEVPSIPTFPGTWPVQLIVPYKPNKFFVGQEKLLRFVHSRLIEFRSPRTLQVQAISGLEGMGKTQVAIEYAYRYRRQYSYILWVNAVTPERLQTDLMRLADLLGVPGREPYNQRATINAFKQWLALQNYWLLILDNADDISLVEDYLPKGKKGDGYVLMTTRATRATSTTRIVEMQRMTKDEAVQLLLSRSRTSLPDNSASTKVPPKIRASAEAIATALDGVPLALDLAIAYIKMRNINLPDYQKLYQAKHKSILAQKEQRSLRYPEAIHITLAISSEAIERTNPAAAELMRLFAFFAPVSLPEIVISAGAKQLGNMLLGPVATKPEKLQEVFQLLRDYSLLRGNPEKQTNSMHRTFQEIIRDGMVDVQARNRWMEHAVRVLRELLSPLVTNLVKTEYMDQAQKEFIEILIVHAKDCVLRIDKYRINFREAGDICYITARYMQIFARYEEAEYLYKQALSIYRASRDQSLLMIGRVQHALAILYEAEGKYDKALSLCKQALSIYQRQLDPDDNEIIKLEELQKALARRMNDDENFFPLL
jgi:tetratricopeptide (TPR) repeat protein